MRMTTSALMALVCIGTVGIYGTIGVIVIRLLLHR